MGQVFLPFFLFKYLFIRLHQVLCVARGFNGCSAPA